MVAGLLQRAKDERRKCLDAAAGAPHVVHDPFTDVRRHLRRRRGRKLLRGGRRRNPQVGELLQQQLDRGRVGTLVDAVERFALARGQQLGDGLVRGDHQLFDQPVRRRLRFLPGTGDATLAIELEVDLRALDAQRAAREAPVAHPRRQPVGELERSNDCRLGLPPLCLPVGEPGLAPDDGAIEGRLPIRRHLDGDAEPVLVRAQAAAIL